MGSSRSNNCSSFNSIFLLNTIIFIIAFTLYCLNEIIFKPKNIIFFKNYMNDFLAFPLLLSFSNITSLILIKRLIFDDFTIIISFSFIVGLFWEYVTPLYYKNSVSDLKDILFYVIGSMVYHLICKNHYKIKS